MKIRLGKACADDDFIAKCNEYEKIDTFNNAKKREE